MNGKKPTKQVKPETLKLFLGEQDVSYLYLGKMSWIYHGIDDRDKSSEARSMVKRLIFTLSCLSKSSFLAYTNPKPYVSPI